MLNKIIAGSLVIILILTTLSLRSIYKDYQNRQAERLVQMQKKVEEVTLQTIEGWNVSEVADAVEDAGLGSKKDFLKTLMDFDFSSYPLVAKNSNRDLEGFLFPDTYRIAKNSSLETVIGKMLANFGNRVSTLGVMPDKQNFVIPGYESLTVNGGDGKPGMSLYDIITLASIIEQESGGKGAVGNEGLSLQEERALVAGVFYNRISVGMALESDATVNYLTGKNTPSASLMDLEVNSPYNTYKNSGLPPGPICNPSLGSIKAALNPGKTDYFFFLHKQPSGKVDFSKTFEEHVRKKLAK